MDDQMLLSIIQHYIPELSIEKTKSEQYTWNFRCTSSTDEEYNSGEIGDDGHFEDIEEALAHFTRTLLNQTDEMFKWSPTIKECK